MKRVSYLLTLLFIAFFATTQSAMAFCAPFWPPERIFIPEDDMHVFINFEDGIERMVVQPAFTGDVDDFGMVVALPSRPVLREAPEHMFNDLEDHTNPFIPTPVPFMMLEDTDMINAAIKSVTVVEQKNIGDYVSTVLQAEDEQDLLDWLDDNGYGYSEAAEENFKYYVNEGGHYFVALKINTEEVQNQTFEEEFFGQLKPLEFAFSSEKPIVPIRIMKGDMDQVSLTLYTLGDDMLYLPGVNTLYSQELTRDNFPEIVVDCFRDPCPQPDEWANEYEARDNKWLVRQELKLLPQKITRDVYLKENTSGYVVSPQKGKRVVDTESFVSNIGIVKGGAQTWTTNPNSYDKLVSGTRLLRSGSRGDDVKQLQQFLNNTLGTSLKEDGIWGRNTHASVAQFQTEYNLKQDGIVGPNTRKFIKLVATE